MNELHVMNDTADKIYGNQKMIGGQPWVIMVWMQPDDGNNTGPDVRFPSQDDDNDDDVYQLYLALMVEKDGKWQDDIVAKLNDGTLVTQAISGTRIRDDFGGDDKALYDHFLSKVNEFVDEKGGDPIEPGTFPDGTITENIIWRVKYGTKEGLGGFWSEY